MTENSRRVAKHPLWMRSTYSIFVAMLVISALGLIAGIASPEMPGEKRRIMMAILVGEAFCLVYFLQSGYILGTYRFDDRSLEFEFLQRRRRIEFDDIQAAREFEISAFRSKYGETVASHGWRVVGNDGTEIVFSAALDGSERIIRNLSPLTRNSLGESS